MSEQKDPLVVVLPARSGEGSSGIDRISDLTEGRARVYRARPLSEAIRRRYSTYAHLLLYRVEGSEKWPRINKPALPEVEDEVGPVTVCLTSLDYDNAHHLPLDVEGYRDLLQKIEDAAGVLDFLPTYTWKTRAGARLLFVHPPLTPNQAEVFHQFLTEHYREKAGIFMDPGVWEWNRPHALPWVVRDGRPLDPDQVVQRDPIPASAMPNLPDHPVTAVTLDASVLRGDMPDPSTAVSLVWKDGDPSGKPTEWGAWAKNRMRGRDAASAWDVPSLEPSRRNPTLFQWAGSLVSMLAAYNESTPEHVYGVLYPTIEANLRPGLDHEIWRGVCYCWAREQAQQEATATARKGTVDRFKDAVREWAPEAPDGEEEFQAWVRQRLVVIHDSCYYVLNSDGRYNNQPVKHAAVVSALRNSGLVGPDRVIPSLSRITDKGKEEPIRSQDVIDRWSTPVEQVVIEGGGKLGGVIRGNTLHLTTFARRSDLTPRKSEWTQQWLEHWFGEHLPVAEQWISAALRFEEGPTCALSLESVGGSGKNLLMEALARTITSQSYSAARNVIGTFQPKLAKTPFVHVDETWPYDRGVHAAFRNLIGTWTQTVNRKNIHETDVRTCPRILMTANKSNLVEALFGDADMSPSEHEATAERVIHLRLGSRGKKWLTQSGGMFEASQKLESGEISAHLLWIMQTNPLSKHRGRFLMEGDPNDPFLRSLAFKAFAVVGEALIKMFETGKITRETKVRANVVLDYMDQVILPGRSRGYNLITLGRDLRHFLNRDRTINVDKLVEFGEAAGLTIKRLSKVV